MFGKPYTVCNRANFRKVLNTIWQHQIFESFDPRKMADHLRLLCAGIEYPLNPAAIPLHRLVFNNPPYIKKYALLQCNLVTYCHIDSGEPIPESQDIDFERIVPGWSSGEHPIDVIRRASDGIMSTPGRGGAEPEYVVFLPEQIINAPIQ